MIRQRSIGDSLFLRSMVILMEDKLNGRESRSEHSIDKAQKP